MTKALLAGVLLVIVAACSSTTVTVPPPTPGPTADAPLQSQAPSPTPIPAAMTKAQAAKRYLTLASANNAAKKTLLAKSVDANGYYTSVAAYDAWARSYAVLTRRFADDLGKSAWPLDVAVDVMILIRQLAAEEAAALRASTAKAWADVKSLDADLSGVMVTRQNTSNLVRAELGLPSVPVRSARRWSDAG